MSTKARVTPDLVLAARAMAVVASVSVRRLRTAPGGATVCVPVATMRELAHEIERQYPGVLAHMRQLTRSVTRRAGRGLRDAPVAGKAEPPTSAAG